MADSSVDSFLSTLDPAVAKMLESCQTKTRDFAKIFLKDAFFRPFSPPHQEIFDALDDDSHQLTCILAPRGIGKTTIVSKAFLGRQILFQNKRHIVYISKSNTGAIEKTENLKWELQTNHFTNKFFGDIKSEQFAKDGWVTSNGVKIVPRGAGQQVRGLLYHNDRPDLIVIDDLEDSKLVLNEELRGELWEWLNSDVLFSVDRPSKNWRIVVIGTLLHEDSILAKLIEDSSWHCIKLRIWDEAHETCWPELYSNADIKAIYDDLCRRGLADLFAREYCNDAVSRENSSFSQKFFKYYEDGELRTAAADRRNAIETVILVDPAKSVNPTSDYSAIVGVSLDVNKNAIYVRDLLMKRLHPDELYRETALMAQRLGAKTVGLEVTSLNEFILQPFKSYMSQFMHQFELVELKARGKKENRIAALIPYYRQGNVFHNSSGCCSPLEDQLLSFPRSKHDDAMDALAYIVEMMELGGKYFQPAAYSEVDDSDAYSHLLAEDSLDPLDSNSWMIA